MSPVSYLRIPGIDSFRHRAASLPMDQDRYGSVGGLINIEDLARRYEASNVRKNHGLFGSVSPRSRTSRKSSDTGITTDDGWESMPTTPYKSEGWCSPTPPQTPPKTQQTRFTHNSVQTQHATSPPVSRYNRYGHDLHLVTHSRLMHLSNELSRSQLEDFTAASSVRTHLDDPIELAGSLLLPSQGFPQSNPPQVPPHVCERSYSAPAALTLSPVAQQDSEPIDEPKDRSESSSPYPTLSLAPTLSDLAMPKRSFHRKASDSASSRDGDVRSLLPARTSSLRARMTMPQNSPPPIPLSRMTMEELMQVLPTLDAAIVAHDWLPCMKKRHQELKELLHTMQHLPNNVAAPEILNNDLEKILRDSHEAADKYHTLFETAKQIQTADQQHMMFEVENANAHRSQATIALARHREQHHEVCQSYERSMQELRDQTRQSFETLSIFIHQYLEQAMTRAPQQQIQQILEILRGSTEQRDMPTRHVSSELYHETQKELKKTRQEKQELEFICSEQMISIRDQSHELERYVARMASTVEVLKDTKCENQELAGEKENLETMLQAHQNSADVDRHSRLDHEQFQQAANEARELNKSMIEEIRARDAEIMNLRKKLDNAFVREQELRNSTRSVSNTVQISDTTSQRPSKLKRLLAGGPRASPNLPSLNSMFNLSQSLTSPFEDEKLHSDVPSSPLQSARTSPSLVGLCEPAAMDYLQLPPPQKSHKKSHSSFEFGPRLRERSEDRDIGSAVSNRFYHMPSNVRSTASVTRPQTAKSSSEVSYDGQSDHFRPRLNSAPEPAELTNHSSNERQLDHERQPLINHQRVLSGITELTEDAGSVKRNSGSPDSADKRMYLESMNALGRLQIHY